MVKQKSGPICNTKKKAAAAAPKKNVLCVAMSNSHTLSIFIAHTLGLSSIRSWVAYREELYKIHRRRSRHRQSNL